MSKTLKNNNKLIKKKKTKKNVYLSKINVPVDFTKKDGGYQDLLNPLLFSFLIRNMKKGNNLIQTREGKPFFCHKQTMLFLQAIPVKKWKQKPEWNEIECKKLTDFLKATPCKIGKSTKLFVKLKSNPHIGGFATYLMAINLGLVDEKKHLEFIKGLKKTFGKKPIKVHNEDVDWFHLKEA
jgi:hypothetical protein